MLLAFIRVTVIIRWSSETTNFIVSAVNSAKPLANFS